VNSILALHNSHNASICEIKNKEIVYFQEAERLTQKKRSNDWKILLKKYINKNFDKIVFINSKTDSSYALITRENIEEILCQHKIKFKKLEFNQGHHFYHACAAFFNSGLEESYALIFDGSGSHLPTDDGGVDHPILARKEIASLYLFKKNKYKKIFKIYTSNKDKEYVDGKNFYIHTLSLGHTYSLVMHHLKFKEEGAVMALSRYGDKVKPLNFFTKKFNHYKTLMFTPYLLCTHTKPTRTFIAYSIQEELEQVVLSYVKNIIKNKKRNLCVSGGVFQNTVLNSKLLDICPNLYVDPFADDSGIAMGAALWHLNKNQFVKHRIKTLFLGDSPNYSSLNLQQGYEVSPTEVAKIIADKNIVGIYQGRNELGKRALGNRSFLYDPRDTHGKEKINLLKNREWCRPTAGTVLYEHRHEWFDLKSKDESEYMSYVFQVRKKDIPGVTHVDNSCRIQTLRQEQNYHYYNLINEFYKLTGVPLLLNTSLNLGGKPLANSVEDVMDIFAFDYNFKFNYIYFPEIGKLYTK